jgi:hypothetical protein
MMYLPSLLPEAAKIGDEQVLALPIDTLVLHMLRLAVSACRRMRPRKRYAKGTLRSPAASIQIRPTIHQQLRPLRRSKPRSTAWIFVFNLTFIQTKTRSMLF